MRLITGILSGQPFAAKLMGDKSLSSRPMGRVVEPLHTWGRHHGPGGNSPVARPRPSTASGHPLEKPCPQRPGEIIDLVGRAVRRRHHHRGGAPTLSRPLRTDARGGGQTDHRRAAGVPRGRSVSLKPCDWVVPSDISSAAFFLVAALITPGSEIDAAQRQHNPHAGMGSWRFCPGWARTSNARTIGDRGEPVADLLVRYAPLRAASFGGDIVPRLVDEIPILALAATQAEGVTEIRGAQELQVKESDRLAQIAKGTRIARRQNRRASRRTAHRRADALAGATLDAAGTIACR